MGRVFPEGGDTLISHRVSKPQTTGQEDQSGLASGILQTGAKEENAVSLGQEMSQVEMEAFGRAVSDHMEGLDLQDGECGVGDERKVRGVAGEPSAPDGQGVAWGST